MNGFYHVHTNLTAAESAPYSKVQHDFWTEMAGWAQWRTRQIRPGARRHLKLEAFRFGHFKLGTDADRFLPKLSTAAAAAAAGHQ